MKATTKTLARQALVSAALSHNKRPAVLVECGFITKRTERARTLSPTYCQRLAECIAMGVIRYHKGK